MVSIPTNRNKVIAKFFRFIASFRNTRFQCFGILERDFGISGMLEYSSVLESWNEVLERLECWNKVQGRLNRKISGLGSAVHARARTRVATRTGIKTWAKKNPHGANRVGWVDQALLVR